jgi:prevent-host-death family protein
MEAGVRELRDHLSRYLAAVRDGQEITVTDHGKAVARLVPLEEPRALDRLVAEGLVTPARSTKRSRSRPRGKPKGTVSDLVAEQRR